MTTPNLMWRTAQIPLPLEGKLAGWLPNETLFSWCSRYHRYAVNGFSDVTSLQLFGSRRGGRAHDLPNSLDSFVERTSGFLGDTEEIIREHTLLPFYLPFRSVTSAKEAISHLKGVGISSLKYQLGILTSGMGAGHPLKICPKCFEADQIGYGVAYWHVEHQLPSSMVCVRHEQPLVQPPIDRKHVSRWQWLLPQDVFTPRCNTDLQVNHSPDLASRLIRIAQTGLQVTKSSPGSFADPGRLAQAFRTGLEDRGLISPLKHLRYTAIREATQAYFDDYLASPEFDYVRSLTGDNGLRRILDGRSLSHPLRYIALVEWLFGEWQAFLQAYVRDPVIEPSKARSSNSVSVHPAKSSALKMLVDGDKSVAAIALELNVDYVTVAAWAAEVAITPRRRPKVLKPDVLETVIEGLRAGKEKSGLASEASVSVSSINRILRTEPGLSEQWHRARRSARCERAKERWQTVLAQLPGVSINLVRQMARADYAWLYRNERDWLKATIENRPTKPIRDNNAAVRMARYDETLASSVEQAALTLSEHRTRGKVKWEDLLAVLPTLRRRQGNLGDFPRTLSVLGRILF